MSTSTELNQEALSRATSGQSFANYPAIYSGFMERGIPEADIRPRENVFTFNAWKARGRVVCKGQHGVKVVTWIPIDEKRNTAGEVTHKAGRRPKSATVFHVSQTEATS